MIRYKKNDNAGLIKLQLSLYEQADKQLFDLRDKYSHVLDKLDSLQAQKDECIASLQKLLYTTNGPPEGANMVSSATARFATGDKFCVEVTYKKRSAYFDPAMLPTDVLTKPGVVAEVNTDAIVALGDKRCLPAWREGAWMKPAVSIKRKRENNEPDT